MVMRSPVRSAMAVVLAAVLFATAALAAQPDRPGGFWKCRATSPVKGEFGGEDPVGLAAGKHIPTDCVIYRAFQEKTYCFGSLPSLEFFSAEPQLLAKAEAFWVKVHAAGAAKP